MSFSDNPTLNLDLGRTIEKALRQMRKSGWVGVRGEVCVCVCGGGGGCRVGLGDKKLNTG